MSRDPSSLSNPDEARVTHLSWDAVVDFDKRQLFANASYDVKLLAAAPPVPTLRLDTSGLDVQRVTVCGKPATFSMSVPDPDRPHLGSRLEIDLRGSGGGVVGVGVGVGGGDVDNPDRDDSNDGGVVISVSIQYATSPNASAAQWLPPSQTAGKEHPYVFSACFVSMHFPPPARPPEITPSLTNFHCARSISSSSSSGGLFPISFPSAMPGHTRAKHTPVPGLPLRQDDLRRPRHRPALGHGRHVGAVQGK